MNIYQAIKLGLPFKRKRDAGWLDASSWQSYTLSNEDLQAEDWIVKEEPISITPTEYWRAVRAAIQESLEDHRLVLAPGETIDSITLRTVPGKVGKILGFIKEED